MPRDYRVFLDDILESTRKILEYTAGFSYEQFSADQKTIEAVVWNLMIIGEAAKNVPEEVRSRYTDVLWREMAGLRDIIVHQYFEIKLDVIWKVIQKDLPRVEERLGGILEQWG
jgi:uncharacterized protein with HEPN domain